MSKFGATGAAIGTAVAAGVGVAAAASIKAAADFDQSFTRIAAISNTSADQIEGMKEQVLALAGETAQSPKELADALFFLASAGLDANEVMPALEASAKAAAVGLGETADVANIVASALNAYSDSGLTAAKATDILVAAVREGRAEPEEFAGALGRILPIASTVGVTFDQVAASMATLSNIGLDVNEGVTAMRGVLQAVAAPGTQAAEAMDDLGLSAQQLLDAISEDGILGALRLLDQAAKSQTTTQADYNNALRKIIPNVRALTGVLGLTVQEASKVDAIFERVLGSTGATAEAFRTTAESDAFQLRKALNDLAIVAQRLGAAALPVLADALGVVARNAETLAIGFAALLALKALPGLLFNIGLALEKIGVAAAASGVRNFAGKLQGMAGPIGIAVTVLTSLKVITDEIARSANEASGAITDFLEAAALGEFEGSIADFNREIDKLLADRDLPDWVRDFAEEQIPKVRQALIDEDRAARDAIDAQEGLATAAREGVGAATESARAHREQAAAHAEAAAAARDQRLAELELAGGLLGVVSSADQLQDSQAELTRLQEKGRQGTEAYRDATAAVLSDALALKGGLIELGGAMIENGRSGEDVAAKLTRIGLNAGLTEADVRQLLGSVQGLTGDLDELGKKDVKPKIGADSDEAKTKIGGIQANLRAITKAPWEAKITADSQAARATIAALDNELHALTADQWEVRIHAQEVAGSPIPSVLIEQLTDALEVLTDTKWEIEIHALGTAQLDQLRAYRKEIAGLQRQYDQLKERADEFRDSIRSGFAEFADIGGTLGGALSDFANAQQDYAEAQEQYAKDSAVYAAELREWQGMVKFGPGGPIAPPVAPIEPAAPLAPDLGAIIAQQVADAETFAQTLRRLAKAGLSTANLQQLAAMGPAGQEVADALLEDRDLIKQMNQATKTIAEVTQTTANKLTDARFGEKFDRLGRDFNQLIQHLERFLERWDLPALNQKTKEFRDAVDRLANIMNSIGGGGGKKPPHLDHGGVVAQSGLAVVHRGETVTPGGGGVTVVVNGDVSGEELVSKVERQLTQRLQRGGAIFDGAVRT